jgi:ketosteroid isomerase-like protein
MKSEVEAAAKRWDEAFNGGDPAKLAPFYAAEARALPAGGPAVDGPEAIAAFFADLQAKGFSDHKITVDNVLEKGATAIATGKWQLTGPAEGGGTTQYGGNWVNVLERTGSGWQVLLHTWN